MTFFSILKFLNRVSKSLLSSLSSNILQNQVSSFKSLKQTLFIFGFYVFLKYKQNIISFYFLSFFCLSFLLFFSLNHSFFNSRIQILSSFKKKKKKIRNYFLFIFFLSFFNFPSIFKLFFFSIQT